MSHFRGTPSHSRVWALKHSELVNVLDHAKASRQRLLSGPTVDVYVGREKKHWSLHSNLLCHHSSYFETEFQGHEVQKKEPAPSHYLPDDDPRGFELLVKWLYQGDLDDTSHMTEEEKYEYAVACHKLYQLCDKFDMIHVKNLAIDLYRQNLNAAQLVPDADEINDIYRASPPGSPFRKLMAKIAARQIMDPGVDKDAESYRVCFDGNPDFAVDMINSIRYMSGGILFDDPTDKNDCLQWHDHRDGSNCHSKGKGKGKETMNGSRVMPRSTNSDRQHPPIAELSERPTPRKLSAAQSPLAAKVSSLKGVLKTGRSPRKLAYRDGTKHKRDTQLDNPPLSNGDAQNDHREPMKRMRNVSLKPPGQTPMSTTAGQIEGVSTVRQGSMAKPTNRVMWDGFDPPSNFGKTPQKPSHVNGIVSHLNGVDVTSNSSRPSSVAGMSEKWSNRPPPPKLKRKTPG